MQVVIWVLIITKVLIGGLTTSDTDIPKHQIELECVMQMPELPTGCEVTSLTTVLQYVVGKKIDKCDVADNYLPQADKEVANPNLEFVGNPRNASDYGCFAPVIANTANEWLYQNGYSKKYIAKEIIGANFEYLLDRIADNKPVIIWVTINLAEPHIIEIKESQITWVTPLHCVVLTGYDKESNIVYVADPLEGNVEYPLTTFKERYEQLGSQAVILFDR